MSETKLKKQDLVSFNSADCYVDLSIDKSGSLISIKKWHCTERKN